MSLFHKKKKPKLNAFVCMLYCPKFDLNTLHVVNSYHNIAICAGCGEIIEGSKEITLRNGTAQKYKDNKFKIWAEARER